MFLFKEKEKKHILTFAIWIEYLGQPLIIYIYICGVWWSNEKEQYTRVGVVG